MSDTIIELRSRRPASQPGGKAELLIVDSEPGIHELLTPLLASAGHKVTAVETAEQANKLLHHKNFGVILLDAKSARFIDEERCPVNRMRSA